jgi:glycosyltransferase involved in cell wall biosynthesis
VRIVFFHEVNYLTKPVYEMHEFPEFLSNAGHEVHFVHFAEGRKFRETLASARVSRAPKRSFIDGETRVVLHTPFQFGGGIFGRAIAFLSGPIQIWRLLRDIGPDVIVSYSIATHGLPLIIVGRLMKIPIMLRVIDVPSEIRNFGMLKTVVRFLEKLVGRFSTSVSALTPALATLFGSYRRDNGSRVAVHAPPLNIEFFNVSKQAAKEYREAVGWGQKNVFVFVGTFFGFSGLQELVADFAQHSLDDEILVIFGSGELGKRLEDQVRNLPSEQASRIHLPGFVEYEMLPLVLSASDVAINSLKEAVATHQALPNKVLQYAAAGLPIVSTPLDSLKHFFDEESACIKWVGPSDSFTLLGREVLGAGRGKGGNCCDANKSLVSSLFGMHAAGAAFESAILELVELGR